MRVIRNYTTPNGGKGKTRNMGRGIDLCPNGPITTSLEGGRVSLFAVGHDPIHLVKVELSRSELAQAAYAIGLIDLRTSLEWKNSQSNG